jgi:hypothetical protein
MVITEILADELIPGDVIDTHCGVGEYAWAEVVRVVIEENDRPGSVDRVWLTLRDTVGDVRGEFTRRTLATTMHRARVA